MLTSDNYEVDSQLQKLLRDQNEMEANLAKTKADVAKREEEIKSRELAKIRSRLESARSNLTKIEAESSDVMSKLRAEISELEQHERNLMGETEAPPAPESAPSISRNKRRVYRQPKRNETLDDQIALIVGVLSKSPHGMRVRPIAEELGYTPKDLQVPIKRALESNKIFKIGEKVGTVYFARNSKSEGKRQSVLPAQTSKPKVIETTNAHSPTKRRRLSICDTAARFFRKDKEMHVRELVPKLEKAGWKSEATNPVSVVYSSLMGQPHRFEKVAPYTFRLKSSEKQ